MARRIATVVSVVILCVVVTLLANDTFSQSGRNRDAQQHRAETPSLTTEDVHGPAPAPSTASASGPRFAVNAPDPRTVTDIAWISSVTQARETAADDQVIFVDVYTDWCGYCKAMDRQVYTDPAVRQFASNHVFVKLNAEDGREGTAFARQNGVRGYPTLFVYSKSGKLIGRQVGAILKPNDFLHWIEAASRRR